MPPFPVVIPMRGLDPIVLFLVAIAALAVGIVAGPPLYSSTRSTEAPVTTAP